MTTYCYDVYLKNDNLRKDRRRHQHYCIYINDHYCLDFDWYDEITKQQCENIKVVKEYLEWREDCHIETIKKSSWGNFEFAP